MESPGHNDPSQALRNFLQFYKKIELVKTEIDSISVDPPDVHFYPPQVRFRNFSLISEDEIRKIIWKSSNASCQLDLIPAWLVKLCCDKLVPVLSTMVNLSLSEGNVPDDSKTSLVLPLLKKFGLDPIFKNFRPVSNLPFVVKLAEKVVIHCAPLPKNQSLY